jgi:hypothetical protein
MTIYPQYSDASVAPPPPPRNSLPPPPPNAARQLESDAEEEDEEDELEEEGAVDEEDEATVEKIEAESTQLSILPTCLVSFADVVHFLPFSFHSR